MTPAATTTRSRRQSGESQPCSYSDVTTGLVSRAGVSAVLTIASEQVFANYREQSPDFRDRTGVRSDGGVEPIEQVFD